MEILMMKRFYRHSTNSNIARQKRLAWSKEKKIIGNYPKQRKKLLKSIP